MSEAINQVLGFDASQAIDALTNLDKQMKSFEGNFTTAVKSMEGFNKQGGKTVSALKQIKENARQAADALKKLHNIQSQVITQSANNAPSGAALKAQIDKNAKEFSQHFPVPSVATDKQARAVQSQVAQMAEFAAKNKVSVKDAMLAYQNMGQLHTGVMNKMADMTVRTGSTVEKAMKGSEKDVHKFTITWETMARVVMTQAIVRALSSLRNAIRDAVGDSIEFEKAVSRIRTITVEKDLARLKGSVESLAVAFNTPLDQTAAAYYETVSAQIGETVPEFEKFTASVLKFAKVTGSDAAASGSLLAGTIHAFGKDFTDAEDVAAKFFRTIDIGNTTAEELAGVFGDVSPIANQLGVSLEELDAAFASLTISGVETSKAATQLRGIFNAMMKPTTDLKKIFHELNVASAEELLAAYDLGSALQLIMSHTDGTSATIAKLFPEVRGLTGELILSAENGKRFAKSLADIQAMSAGMYDQTFDLQMNTNAEQVTKELHKLKVFLTTGFGDEIIKAARTFMEALGGVDRVINVLKTLASMLPWATAGIVGLGTALVALRGKAMLAAAGLATLKGPLLILAGIGAAMTLGDFLGREYLDSFDRERKAFKEAMDKQVKDREAKAGAEIKAESRKLDAVLEFIRREALEAQKHLFERTDALAKINETRVADAKFFSEQIIATHEKEAEALSRRADSMGKEILESEQNITKARQHLSDRLFKTQQGQLSDYHKFFKILERGQAMAAAGAQALSKAQTPEQRDLALETHKRGQALIEESLAMAENSNNRAMLGKATGALTSSTDALVRAETAYQKSQAQSMVQAEEQARQQEEKVAKLKQIQEEYLEAIELTDKQGNLLDEKTRGEQLKKASAALHEFIQIASADRPLSVAEMLNFQGVQTQLNDQLRDVYLQKLTVTDEAIHGVEAQIQEAVSRMVVKIPLLADIQAVSGVQITDQKSFTEAMAGVKEKFEAAKRVLQEYEQAQQTIEASTKKANQALIAQQGTMSDVGVVVGMATAEMQSLLGSDASYQAVQNLSAAVKDMQLAFRDPSFDGSLFEALRQRLIELNNDLPRGFEAYKLAVIDSMNELYKVVEARKKLNQMEKSGQSPLEAQSKLMEYERLLQASEMLKKPKQDAKAMSEAAASAQTAFQGATGALSAMAASSKAVAANMQAAAEAAAKVGVAGAAPRAFGGLMYLASGGRGIDQIPAMLAPHEVVMNQRASRNFFSQLQAMNAGMQPVYREHGGEVTNIGDVNITVHESGNPRATAREVMNSMRRELRRRSGRI